MRLGTLAMALLLAGCGTKKQDAQQGESPPTATTQATTPPPPAGGKLELAAALAGTTKPALFGPYAKARFGMTPAELGAVVPDYQDLMERPVKRRDPEGAYYAWFDQHASARGFDILSVIVPSSQVGEVAKAWGPPLELNTSSATEKRRLWFDPEARIRGTLHKNMRDEDELELQPYVPLAEVLGAPGMAFGFETAGPLVGATAEQLAARYPKLFRGAVGYGYIDLAPDEYGDTTTFTIRMKMVDDKVAGFMYFVEHGGDPKLKAERKKLLEAKYGASTVVTAADGKQPAQLRLGTSTPEVMVFDEPQHFRVMSPRDLE